MPTIHNIQEILGSYAFDPTTDIVLISLLHCDLLNFNHEKGFCWANNDLRDSDIITLCAKYAALHKWIVDHIKGNNRPISIQLLMLPSFHFTRYNKRYFEYVDQMQKLELKTKEKHFKEGEVFISMKNRADLMNDVHTSYITNCTTFSRLWKDHFGELVMLNVNKCIDKVYVIETKSIPEKQDLRKELHAFAEGHCPSNYMWNHYSPFSLDGIMPSHEGVARILRNAYNNYGQCKYSECCSLRPHLTNDDKLESYSPHTWDHVFTLSRTWSEEIHSQWTHYENITGQTFHWIPLDGNVKISERSLVPVRNDEVELTKRMKEMWYEVMAITKNLRDPMKKEVRQAAFTACKNVPTKTKKRNVRKRRQRKRKRLLEAKEQIELLEAKIKKRRIEEESRLIPTVVSTGNYETQTKFQKTYKVAIDNEIATGPYTSTATAFTSTQDFHLFQPSTSNTVSPNPSSSHINPIFPSPVFTDLNETKQSSVSAAPLSK